MGVRGLTTYIKQNETFFLKDHVLHDTCLVIDGHSLCAQLYKGIQCYSAFGGDYDVFAKHVKKFFKNLRKCNIKGYVLFDGSVESKKIRTTLSRLRSKLEGACHLHPGDKYVYQMFPLLVRDVFKEVLEQLGICYSVCEFEADDEIAALSRFLKCPVLSYDSDFFIYNVQYIPFPSLFIKPILIDLDEGNSKYGIQCKLFRTQFFCEHFKHFTEELMPLLATLLGNDYHGKNVFSNFFNELKLPKSKSLKNEQQRTIKAVIDFLQHEQLESAAKKVIGRLKSKHKAAALQVIHNSCAAYNSTHCASLKFLDFENDVEIQKLDKQDLNGQHQDEELTAPSQSEESSISTLYTIKDVALPEWFVTAVRSCRIPQPYLNLYTHKVYFLIPQVEDFSQSDSLLCCSKLLRYAFDILHGFPDESFVLYSREGSQYKKMQLDSSFSIKNNFGNLYPLVTEKSPNFVDEFLKQTVTCNIDTFKEMPVNSQLLFISMVWWRKTCHVTQAHLYAIILCFVMLEAVDDRTGQYRGDEQFQKTFSTKLEEIRSKQSSEIEREVEYFLDKQKVSYEHSLIAASKLLKLFEYNEKLNSKKFNKKRIHPFAQFQCCLQQFNYINALSSFKYTATIFHKSFNGTFVNNALSLLENRTDVKLFLSSHLNGAHSVLKHFYALCDKFESICAEIGIEYFKEATSSKRRKYKKKNEIEEILFEFNVMI